MLFLPAALPLILGGGALLGSATSSLANWASTKSTNQANLDLYYAQREWDKPINQMQRLKEAGLNPNLVYGHGAVANTAPSTPSLQAPRIDDLGEGISRAQQIMNNNAQLDNIVANTEATRIANLRNDRDRRIEYDLDNTRGGKYIRSTDPYFVQKGAQLALEAERASEENRKKGDTWRKKWMDWVKENR